MFDFSDFYCIIAKNQLSPWLNTLPNQLSDWNKSNHDSRLKNWLNVIDKLPALQPEKLELSERVYAASPQSLTTAQQQAINALLKHLMPWRKGPFDLYGTYIDTEWRSDKKWQRVLPHLENLQDRLILDVGCGSGYHLWRMVGAGAKLAVGIDPMALFLCQFEAVRKLLGNDQRAHHLPLGIEQLPELAAFDTVFSMGVLYHRRSPLDHLIQLKNQLRSEGQLVLETLVIEGDEQQVLMPGERYAQMSNVYFIPSANALKNWLIKCGFIDIQLVDLCVTTTEEQRRTEWIASESLDSFLDPKDSSKTIEGYPAPLRAIITAKKR